VPTVLPSSLSSCGDPGLGVTALNPPAEVGTFREVHENMAPHGTSSARSDSCYWHESCQVSCPGTSPPCRHGTLARARSTQDYSTTLRPFANRAKHPVTVPRIVVASCREGACVAAALPRTLEASRLRAPPSNKGPWLRRKSDANHGTLPVGLGVFRSSGLTVSRSHGFRSHGLSLNTDPSSGPRSRGAYGPPSWAGGCAGTCPCGSGSRGCSPAST
jgi:hypothetical protein